MKEAVFKYRCRMCGAKFGNASCPNNDIQIHKELTNAIHNVVVNNQSPMPMHTIHQCKEVEERMGIGDLIGIEIEGEDV